MVFVRAWDEGFPPDTQNANLLGLDIRQFKEDVKERIRAFGAGVIAARETPEATFGDANKGVLYYATDENKLYRWNGSAWLLVKDFSTSAVVLFNDLSQSVITNPVSTTVGASVVIPANTGAQGSLFEIFGRVYKNTGAGNPNQELRFGAIVISTLSSGGTARVDLDFHAWILAVELGNMTGFVRTLVKPSGGATTPGLDFIGGAIPSLTASITVDMRTFASADATLIFDGLSVRVTRV